MGEVIMPKISIIVPVYNVEEYIHRCIDSILAQTFTDFELILVNDGSPDQCGKICDKYAENDSRIKVIHKKNGGVAEARNFGLEIAQSQYIGFVDSDDYIESTMYEKLYTACINNSAEISVCGRCDIYENKKESTFVLPKEEIWDKKKAIENLLTWNNIDSSVCDKLIKSNIFEGLKFPVDKNVEDIFIAYKLIFKSNKICHIGEPLYNYCHRKDSRSVEDFSEERLDMLEVSLNINKFVNETYPDLKNKADSFYYKHLIYLLKLLQLKGNSKENYEHNKKSRELLASNLINIFKNQNIEMKNKIVALLLMTNTYKTIKNILGR